MGENTKKLLKKHQKTLPIIPPPQAFFNSIAGAVSLHATLGSLGVGQGHASPLSATLTWLTNSGAGMLTSVCFTYCKVLQFVIIL